MSSTVDSAAAVPYRIRDGQLEICLITTRSRLWGIPKGLVDPDDSPETTALKEAEEEAGLLGHLVGEALGTYSYEKEGSELTVQVFLMQVERTLEHWDEAEFRERKWVEADEALNLLKEHPGAELILATVTFLKDHH